MLNILYLLSSFEENRTSVEVTPGSGAAFAVLALGAAAAAGAAAGAAAAAAAAAAGAAGAARAAAGLAFTVFEWRGGISSL